MGPSYEPQRNQKLTLTPREEEDVRSGRKIIKTDSFSNEVLVDHPDRFTYDENGRRRSSKQRNRSRTNLTPKKKKRKR